LLHVGQHHVHPLSGQPTGERTPDTARGTGDHCDPTIQLLHQTSNPSNTRVVSVSVLLSTTKCCVAACKSRKHRCSTLGRSASVPAAVYANRTASVATRVAYVVACRSRCRCTNEGSSPASSTSCTAA